MKSTCEAFAGIKVFDQLEAHPASIAEYYSRNKRHLEPSMPQRSPNFYTEAYWRDELVSYELSMTAGKELRFVMMSDNDVVGCIDYSQIVRGAFQACYLGYSIDIKHQGRGLMRMSLLQTISEIILRFDLNRIMANYEPTNMRSGKLLKSLGFEQEGFARNYLKLNGVWKDHVLTSYVSG